METKANHVLIGAFTLAIGAALLLFVLWASRYSADRAWNEYDVVFEEAVTGLSVGGVVQYNGITVGEVRDLSLDPQDPSRVIARIRLDADTPVTTDTVAQLGITGLTGIAFIQLSGGSAQAPLLHAASDDEVPTIVAKTSALQSLLASSEDIATTVSDVVVRIRKLLSEENMERIGAVIADVEAISDALANERENIGSLVADASEAARTLNATLADAERLIARLDGTVAKVDSELVDELPQLVDSLDRSLSTLEELTTSANAVVAENREAFATFTNQGLVQVGPAMTELRTTLRELARLVERIEDDPAAFLLGRGQPQEFEPE